MNIYRGDIYYIENAKFIGIEQQNTVSRPAVIVSNDKCNAHSQDCTVVFLTTHNARPDLPTHVPIICKQQSTALCETVSIIDKRRVREFVRACTDAEMQAIDAALMVQLGIDSHAAPMVDVEALKAEHASAMKALESSETKHFALECKLRDAERSLAERMAEGDDTAAALDTELIRAQAERDVYKRLYEQLLDRMSN